MKKKHFLLIVFYLAIQIAHSQIAVIDSKAIRDSCLTSLNGNFDFKTDAASVTRLAAHLKSYLPEQSRTVALTEEQVLVQFKDNPFFGVQIERLRNGGQSATAAKLISNIPSGIGGINITNLASGLADLMIERAKEELTVAFFDRFKKFVKENPEFGVLFPKTTNNLNNLLSYKYPEMLPTLRTGFVDDLSQITFRLDDVLDMPRYVKLFENFPEVRIAIRSLRLVQELESGASNAADILKELSEFTEWDDNGLKADDPKKDELKNVGAIIKTATLLSESIRIKDEKNETNSVWVSAKDLKLFFKDEISTTIYLGLLYQSAKNDAIEYKINNTTTRVCDLISKVPVKQFYDKLREFNTLTERVNSNYKDLKRKISTKSVSDDDYYNYINVSLDVVEYGLSLAKMFDVDTTKSGTYISLLRESNDVYRNVYKKQYGQAIVNSIDLLTKILALPDKNKITMVDASKLAAGKITELTVGNGKLSQNLQWTLRDKTIPIRNLDTYVTDGDKTYFLSSISDGPHPIDKLKRFIEDVKPYALFIANIAQAENEDDVKNALEAVILPVGSSSVKKYSSCNISVQSYLGARVNFANNDPSSSWGNQWGVIAPVGFAFSKGTNCGGKHPSSLSLFVSLLDVGAIVDYKLTMNTTTNTTTQDYQIKLGQIFAPGGYFVWGLPAGVPLSVGAGGQYGPGIFKSSNGIQDITPGWRWNIFIGVDLPFFTLSNKVRDKRK